MNDIFGIPVSGVVAVLTAVFALALAAIAAIAWRRPVIVKLGVRNIPRRRAQSTLIVAGLMLSTLIISAALGTGDTLHHSLTKDSYETLGRVDALVVVSGEHEADNVDTEATFDAGALGTVEEALAGDDAVDGILPVLNAQVSAVDTTTRRSEPALNLLGVDADRLDRLGGLRGADGGTIAVSALGPQGVVVSSSAAEALDAEVGDAITVYYRGAELALTVEAVADDTYLSGYRRGRETRVEYPGLVLPLAAVQALTGQPGRLSAIAISGAGGIRAGETATDEVIEALRPALAGTGLGVDAVKRAAVDEAEQVAGSFSGVFLVLGLFSVLAGSLLIVLIFTMLVAERRAEMGMARAVGTHRRHLVQQLVSEGAGYAVLAGVVGSALGSLASVGIAGALRALLGDDVPVEADVQPRSIVAAYLLGVVITLVTVVVASWRVSRLDVVAAIRDLPDAGRARRRRGGLIGGLALLAVGSLLAVSGGGGGSASALYVGLSLAPFGLALLARVAGAASRPTLSTVGIAVLTLWLLPQRVGERVWGELESGPEMFFLSGVFMVVGATILTMQNTDLLLRGISALASRRPTILPAVRTAVAYPAAARGRTGMTIAMFSLIVFSLVMMATMSANFAVGDEADAGWDVRLDVPGGVTTTPLVSDLTAAGVDTSTIRATGTTTNPSTYSSRIRLAGTDTWKLWPVVGVDAAFLAGGELLLQQRAEGYATDAEVLAALGTEPNVAVINAWALDSGGLGGRPDAQFVLTGLSPDDESFAPVSVELAGPDGSVSRVTIIGVLDEKITTLSGLLTSQATVDRIYPTLTSTSVYLALGDGDGAEAVAAEIEAATLEQGIQATAIAEELEDAAAQQNALLYMIEGFMGLGLLVGVAAVGVIAFRSVVERRQQIGVLRALGFQRALVSLGMLVETGFVVGLGTLTGTALGIVLARNLLTSGDAGSPAEDFTVPWALIAVIVAATAAGSLGMTWLPSRRAGRIAPAQALRYE